MNDEDKELLEEYRKDVEWLRERVPRDDIYDFAQQMVMSAEFILEELGKHADIENIIEKDPILEQWIYNVMSIYFMKKEGFNGIINTSISVGKR